MTGNVLTYTGLEIWETTRQDMSVWPPPASPTHTLLVAPVDVYTPWLLLDN